MAVELATQRLVVGERSLDHAAFIGLEGVEGVKLDEGTGARVRPHQATTPAATSSARRRRIPARIRLLTVPSGSPRRSATWR